MSKMWFEEWLCEWELKNLHSNNDIFTADMFRGDWKQKGQIKLFLMFVLNTKMQ